MSTSDVEIRLQTLQEQINSAADANLRQDINSKYRQFRREMPSGPFEFQARDSGNANVRHTVVITQDELYAIIEETKFFAMRDTNRRAYTEEFLKRVDASGQLP